ncbi:hypothetical protein C8J56DRAFT_956501 [Mycena floridula]|nr:hypothetical protein C8J56DRAFT_956501 [Mycena floridula]
MDDSAATLFLSAVISVPLNCKEQRMSAHLLRAARAGTLSAIKKLGILSQPSQTFFHKMLPILFVHISISPPVMLPAETLSEAELLVHAPSLQLIIVCLEAISLGIRSLSNGEEAKQVLSNYWTPLYPWLQFIIETVIASKAFLRADDQRHANLCDVVAELLILTRDEIPVSKQLSNHKKLSLRLWLHSYGAGTNPMKLYGTFLDKNERPTGNLDVSTVIAQFPGGAAAVLGQLQRASKQCRSLEDYLALAGNLMLVSYAFPSNCSGVHPMPLLRRQFSSAGVIPVLVQLMSRLTSTHNHVGAKTVDQPSEVYQVASSILVNVIDYLGPASVHQAFASGIFKVITAAVPLLRHTNHTKSYINLAESLSRTLIQPYILRQAKKSIDVASLSSLIKSSAGDVKVIPALTGLRDAFIQARDTRREYKIYKHGLCSHSKCKSEGVLLQNVKRCSGCHSAHYCSSECQKLDWKLGHSTSCKPPPVLYSYQTAPVIDEDYICWFLILKTDATLKNVSGAMHSFMAARKGRYPVIIEFDYTRRDISNCRIFSGEEFMKLYPEDAILTRILKGWTARDPDDYDALLYASLPDPESTAVSVHCPYKWSAERAASR